MTDAVRGAISEERAAALKKSKEPPIEYYYPTLFLDWEQKTPAPLRRAARSAPDAADRRQVTLAGKAAMRPRYPISSVAAQNPSQTVPVNAADTISIVRISSQCMPAP
jgi:hypothetical protein